MNVRFVPSSSLAVLALLVACACAPAPAAPTGASAPPGSGAAPPGSAPAPPASAAAAPAAPAAELASPPAPAPRLETVKIATQPIPNFAAVFIGRERGYLREEGTEIEEVPFD